MQKKINRKKRTKGRTAPHAATKKSMKRTMGQQLADIIALEPKNELAAFSPGDVVRVHARIFEGSKERIQIFEGTVIRDNNTAEGGSFTVRKNSHGVGVERIFQRNSKKVAKVERVTPGRVRRAKLFYLRELEGRAAKVDRDTDAMSAAEAPTT